MNEITLEKICAELGARLIGQKFGKIFALARLQLAIDFRLANAEYLFVSVETSAPRVYLIKRRLRDLEKQSKNSSAFVSVLRKRLAHAVLRSIEKLANERILRLRFAAQNEVGEAENYALIIQLTGRSANLFLLDKNDFIIDTLRENSGAGQEIAARYAPPLRDVEKLRKDDEIFPQDKFASLSESLDAHYLNREIEQKFQARANAARNKLKQETKKREKLLKNLQTDLANHGDAAQWKRFGDLLLANLATAQRKGEEVFVIDYFADDAPTLAIAVDTNDSLTAAAEKFFKKYTKARNAKEEIAKRLAVLQTEIADLNERKKMLEKAIDETDENYINEISGAETEKPIIKSKDKSAHAFKGARRFESSEGFEILVGKASKDNDYLTFRIAKSADLWMHASDYPGSHVVVRNPNRVEIPPKTLLEAAQIAAFYSQARTQNKVAVNYTPKKFVNKPKGAAFGLVSLSSFKTILVEPKINEN